MIKLSDGGAYLINGVDIVEDSASAVNEVAAKTGCSVTKEEAAKTLSEVKHAMKIDYFSDPAFIEEQKKKFN